MEETLQIIYEQTNNNCRFRIFISTNSLHQLRLLAGKYDSRPRSALVHNFLRKRCTGSRKWSWLIQWMIQCLRHLLVVFQIPNFQLLDARIASALNKIIHTSHFKKRISLEEQRGPERGPLPSRQADCFLDLRILQGYWSQRFCRELCRLVHYQTSK